MKKVIPLLFLTLIIAYFLFLLRPALLGELSGTFKKAKEPVEYVRLENYLSTQNSFFRTFWLPTIQRFGYYSKMHPAIPVGDFIKSTKISEQIKFLQKKETEKLFEESGVKYVIVPYDSQREIYLKDRKYDQVEYKKIINAVSSVKWLKKIEGFGKIAVFEVSNPKEHFWSDSVGLGYKYISPVEYVLEVKNAKKGDLVIFADNFDSKWFARDTRDGFYDRKSLIPSSPYKKTLNSFMLRKDGNYSLSVYYYPQVFVNVGTAVSLISFILLAILILYLKKRNV